MKVVSIARVRARLFKAAALSLALCEETEQMAAVTAGRSRLPGAVAVSIAVSARPFVASKARPLRHGEGWAGGRCRALFA